MRSTMTLYRAGSPMRVPPSFTISAVTPSRAPSFLTRSIKAGGKLYSRPQRRPTVFMFVLLSGNGFAFRRPSIHRMCRGSARLGYARARFGNQMPDHRLQVAGLLIYAQLPVRAGAFVHDRVCIFDGAAAAQIIDDVIHKFQRFGNQLAHGHFGFLAEVNEFSINTVARRSPLVLFDDRAAVQPPAHVGLVEAVQLHNDGLGQRRDVHGLLDSRRDVKQAEFQRAEGGVRADVPPNLLAVVDGVQLHEQVYEIFVGAPGFELLWHASPREPAKHCGAERLQPRISAHPKG